jgi:outer membrane protein assembly complex protein YaeT
MGDRGRLNPLALILLVVLAGGAQAGPTTYTDFLVEEILFDAPEAVDVDDLRYLLELQRGEEYCPADVRRSIELLYGVGLFQEVYATVQLDGTRLLVTFHLVPSPTLREVSFVGLPASISRVRARESLAVRSGDAFFPGDHLDMALQLETLLADEGYMNARVKAEVVDRSEEKVAVRLRVDPDEAFTVSSVEFNPGAGLPSDQLRRATRAATQENRRFRTKHVEAGRERLERLYRKRLGYLEARVLPPLVEVDREAAAVQVIYNVVPGQVVAVEFTEIPDPDAPQRRRRVGVARADRLRRVIGLDREYNISTGYMQDATDRVEMFYRDRGHFEVEVSGRLVEEDEVKHLRFEVVPGRRAVLVSARDVRIEGNDVIRDVEIRQLAKGRLRAPFRRPGVTDEALDGLLQDVAHLYESKGYLGAEPSLHELRRESRGTLPMRAVISLRMTEGVQTRVRDVEIRGNERIATEEIRVLAQPLLTQPVRRAEVDRTLTRLRDLYASRGYADVQTSSLEDLSEDGTEATLIWEVAEGPRIQFGKVVVRGNRYTRTWLIRNELSMRPGRVWNAREVAASRQRLMDTGLFSQVRVRPLNTTERVRDVLVEVTERKRWRLMLGPGISTAEGIRMVAEGHLGNIGGVGHRWTTYLHFGIDSESLRLFGPATGITPFSDLEAEWKIVTGYEFAHIPRLPMRINVRVLLNERVLQPTYVVQKYGVGVGATLRLPLPSDARHELRASWGFDVIWRYPEYVDPAAVLCDADLADPDFSNRFMGLVGASQAPQSLRRLGMLWLGLQLDLRDDTFNPTSGLYLTADLEATEPTALSQEKFGRFRQRVSFYLPLMKWMKNAAPGWPFYLVSGFEWGIGWLGPDTAMLPVEWRFRLGGASSLRGYQLETLGPTVERNRMLSDLGFTESTIRVPVGGDVFYSFAIEEHFPLNRKRTVEFILFQDGGNAYLRLGDDFPELDRSLDVAIRASAGVGLRVRTPIGPLRLDVGAQLGSESSLFHPELGPWWKGMNIHFSVGAL